LGKTSGPLAQVYSKIAYCLKQSHTGKRGMDVVKEVTRLLDEVLSLGGRGAAFTRDTQLLGAIPELDSMAVVTLITTLEERFGIAVDDDDIDGATFSTVGTLADFVGGKLAA
jgi:acyl carrier protein